MYNVIPFDRALRRTQLSTTFVALLYTLVGMEKEVGEIVQDYVSGLLTVEEARARLLDIELSKEAGELLRYLLGKVA